MFTSGGYWVDGRKWRRYERLLRSGDDPRGVEISWAVRSGDLPPYSNWDNYRLSCPTCGASRGKGCVSFPSGSPTQLHAARRNKVHRKYLPTGKGDWEPVNA